MKQRERVKECSSHLSLQSRYFLSGRGKVDRPQPHLTFDPQKLQKAASLLQRIREPNLQNLSTNFEGQKQLQGRGQPGSRNFLIRVLNYVLQTCAFGCSWKTHHAVSQQGSSTHPNMKCSLCHSGSDLGRTGPFPLL